jgi:hypothetical protein
MTNKVVNICLLSLLFIFIVSKFQILYAKYFSNTFNYSIEILFHDVNVYFTKISIRGIECTIFNNEERYGSHDRSKLTCSSVKNISLDHGCQSTSDFCSVSFNDRTGISQRFVTSSSTSSCFHLTEKSARALSICVGKTFDTPLFCAGM